MNDPLARTAIRNAHRRINELNRTIAQLEKRIPNRPPMFIAHCALCGQPCRPNRRYCHAHSWAEGT